MDRKCYLFHKKEYNTAEMKGKSKTYRTIPDISRATAENMQLIKNRIQNTFYVWSCGGWQLRVFETTLYYGGR